MHLPIHVDRLTGSCRNLPRWSRKNGASEYKDWCGLRQALLDPSINYRYMLGKDHCQMEVTCITFRDELFEEQHSENYLTGSYDRYKKRKPAGNGVNLED